MSGASAVPAGFPRSDAIRMASVIAAALVAAVLLALPLALYPVFIMQALCFALFASAYNLLAGYAGLLSFGHAAFFGTASYVTAHSAKVWGFPPELALAAGIGSASLLGAVFGWLATRTQGVYFAMITLALAQMIYFIAVQAPFTHGDDGIQSVPRGHLFGLIDLDNVTAMYYVVLAVCALALLLLFRIVNSPFGEILGAIRENEMRATSLGYNSFTFKLIACVLSAALSGLAGSLKCLVMGFATLHDLQFGISGEVLLMCLVGGLGTFSGPILGAFIFVVLEHVLSAYGAVVTMTQGAMFMACVIFFRDGVVGELTRRLKTFVKN